MPGIDTTVTPFNPERPFTVRAPSFLEAADIPLKSSLGNYAQQLQKILNLDISFPLDVDTWLKGDSSICPTWKNLLLLIRLFNLDGLAQQVETYLSGEIVEPHSKVKERGNVIAEDSEQIEICHLNCSFTIM